MENKILITGATSNFGGRDLVKKLSLNGVEFRAAIHSMGKSKKVEFPGVDIIRFDFTKPETIRQALSGIERLFLLIPFKENMLDMAENLLSEASNMGVKHIVYLSIINAEKERSKITKLHRECEKMIEKSGMLFTFLRPNFFMQNFSQLGTIKKMNSFVSIEGGGDISYVDARDVAAIALEALTKEGHYGKTYTLTGPEALNDAQIADIFFKLKGKPINIIKYNEEMANKSLKSAGFSDWYSNFFPEIAETIQKGIISAVSPDIKNVLGREPISFAQFVQDYVNAFR